MEELVAGCTSPPRSPCWTATHRLRRPGADQADHDGGDLGRHAVPRLRHLDGPGAAGRACRPTSSTRYLAEAELEPLTDRTVTDADRLRELLAEVAEQGYAIVDQELEEGLRAVAAPIRGAVDVGMAAINVSAHASRVSMDALREEILPVLLETASQIEADLRAQGDQLAAFGAASPLTCTIAAAPAFASGIDAPAR